MSLKEKVISLLKEYGVIKADVVENIQPQEEMISFEVVYEPDVKDSHGHWASKETLEKACENFNKNLKKGIVKSNLLHVQDTEDFTVEDSWIQKELNVLVEETGEKIKAGTWVAKLKYHNPELWELKKTGVLGGVSIGAMAEVNEETGELTNISFDEALTTEGED